MKPMTDKERLKKLIDLEEKVRVALLGEDYESRYDLVDLQKKVRSEIKKMTKATEVSE